MNNNPQDVTTYTAINPFIRGQSMNLTQYRQESRSLPKRCNRTTPALFTDEIGMARRDNMPNERKSKEILKNNQVYDIDNVYDGQNF